MRIVRYFSHFEDSPGELVAVSIGLLGLPEFLQCHGAALVGWADPQGCGYRDGGHECLVLLSDGTLDCSTFIIALLLHRTPADRHGSTIVGVKV